MVVDVILSGGGSGGSEETTMDDSEGKRGRRGALRNSAKA